MQQLMIDIAYQTILRNLNFCKWKEKSLKSFEQDNCIIRFILLKGSLWLLHEEQFGDDQK